MTDRQPVPATPALTTVPLLAGRQPSGPRPAGRVRSEFRLGLGEVPLHVVARLDAEDAAEVSAGAGAPAPVVGGVDWVWAEQVRGVAAKRFSDRAMAAADQVDDREARQELGRAVIAEVVREACETKFSLDGVLVPPQTQHALAAAVFDLMFRLGRLQPLVDRVDVENIIAVGHDQVYLQLTDGTRVPGPPIAGSDSDLVSLLQDLAARADPPRVFSDANPSLHLNLEGARLAAQAFVTHRPSVVIRRHGLLRVSLSDLVQLGTVSPVMASFLAAAVKARSSIVVAGEQGDGKTTLLRALCAEIGPEEVVGVFETERELGLERMPREHPVVFSWEARPGSGEKGPDGRPVNEFTLQDGMYDSFRFALDRQIVGEVRGPEVAQMILAMESGSGSLSTTHSRSASDTMEKLTSCAMQSGEITREAAIMKLARCVDVVVHMASRMVKDYRGGLRKQRVVNEVVAITPGESGVGFATTSVFEPTPYGPAHAGVLPDHLRFLEGYGFDAAGFVGEAQLHRRLL